MMVVGNRVLRRSLCFAAGSLSVVVACGQTERGTPYESPGSGGFGGEPVTSGGATSGSAGAGAGGRASTLGGSIGEGGSGLSAAGAGNLSSGGSAGEHSDPGVCEGCAGTGPEPTCQENVLRAVRDNHRAVLLEYDAGGLLAEVIDAEDGTLRGFYLYDAAGRLTYANFDGPFVGMDSYRDSWTFAYDSSGVLEEITHAYGWAEDGSYTRRYDGKGLILEARYENLDSYGYVSNYAYEYNEADFVESLIITSQDIDGEPVGEPTVISYDYAYEYYPNGQIRLRIATDVSRGEVQSHLWFDSLGNPVLYYVPDSEEAVVRIDGNWTALTGNGGSLPLAWPGHIFREETWPGQPMQFGPASVESVELDVAHIAFSRFTLDYEFDDDDHPVRISCTLDGELAFELTIARCPDTITERLRYTDGTTYIAEFRRACEGAVLGPPSEWPSCQ